MLLKDLTTLTASLASGTLFHVEKSGKAYNIDYTKLAKAIVEEYNGSTLGGSAQTVQAAIGALNSRRIQKTITFDSISPRNWKYVWISDLETYSNIKQKIRSISLVSSDGAVFPYVLLHSNDYLYCAAYNFYSSEVSNVSIDVIIELSV